MMRVIKFLMMLVGGLFVMAVLRTIMGGIQKGMGDMGRQPAPVSKTPEFTPGGELKKCAACGVYNTASNSVTKVRGGETVYYCSSECRAKAAAA
jgi:hypothetical protein